MEIGYFERICKDPPAPKHKPRVVTGVSGIEYIFAHIDPDDDKSPRVAKVDDARDIAMFMRIEEGYRVFEMPKPGKKGMTRPCAAPAAAPAPTPAPAQTEGATSEATVDAAPESPAPTPPPPSAYDGFLDRPVPAIKKALKGRHGMSKQKLEELLYAEKAGKTRVSAVRAIEAALAK